MKGSDVWGALWPSVPKVHLSVKEAILGRIGLDATYETIIHMVELNLPKADIEDQIATARAIRDTVRVRRMAVVQDQNRIIAQRIANEVLREHGLIT